VALYFVNWDNTNGFENDYEFVDYRVRQEATFIRFIDWNVFGTNDFRAEQSRRTGRVFNHSETLLIPREQFDNYPVFPWGTVMLAASFIVYCETRNIYFDGNGARLEIKYRFINDNTIEFINR